MKQVSLLVYSGTSVMLMITQSCFNFTVVINWLLQVFGLTSKRRLFLFQLPRHVLPDSKLVSDPSSQSYMGSPKVLWPPTDSEEELKKKVALTIRCQTCTLQCGCMTRVLSLQHQAHFLMHRRLCMNVERREVKENQQHRKHLKRTAR